MDKQKQIEEMAKVLAVNCGECYTCKYHGDVNCIDFLGAEELYNAGYRKIPENAVVLKREEYGSLVTRPNLHTAIDVFAIRKETAEKFAELALREIKAISAKSEHLLEDESVYEDSALENVLEKVKKKITEVCK